MTRRRIKPSHAREEGFFGLLFLVLLFLSVLRVIDLLPPPEEAEPAFSEASPAKMTEEPSPEPLSLCDIHAAVLSRGLDLRGEGPKILIYHTHTTEAYTATEASPYAQTSAYRTADPDKSVLAVGEALAERLRVQYGFSVIHDLTDHEPPSLKTAYTRSEQTMRRYIEQYPSLTLFIDIHRDAGSDPSDFVMVDGSPAARIMCVVGKGTEYEEKPDFERNYALACALTEHLRAVDGRLARDVRVKTGRYNQHVGQLSLLIEVGHNANTLEQALHAVPTLAECLALTAAEMNAPAQTEQEWPDLRRSLVPGYAGIDNE